MEGISVFIGRYRETRLTWYRWRSASGATTMVLLSLGMSCFTGIMAQAALSLPWTPVPVTGQTLAVLIAKIDEGRGERPLASACRVAALAYARAS